MKCEARVYLVGAGPGDPDLLTVKALRLLQSAEAVVHDRLVSEQILALIPPTVEQFYVGKAAGAHHYSQDDINTLLLRLSRQYGCIVRLKGGDPYIFGRGGEEKQFLNGHGIHVEAVPGITAASSAACTGIPLTHRGLASAVTFVTGHCRGDAPLDLDWRALASADTTVVFYMALAHLARVQAALLAYGRAANTPVALIENGTSQAQRHVVTRLDRLAHTARTHAFQPPTVVLIGRVAALAEAGAMPQALMESEETAGEASLA